MKKGVIWIILTCLMVASLILVSCNSTTSTQTTTSTSTTTTNITSSTTSATATVTTPSATTTNSVTTTASGNWWDKDPKPQYGGELVIRNNRDFVSFDPYNGETPTTVESAWLERMFADDWTVNPTTWDYKIDFRPDAYTKGQLAQTWEFSNPNTLVVHLRQGIHWQNIPPANGRLFNANDIVFHFDRMLGMGDGYTTPSPYWSNVAWTKTLTSVTATGDYTVTMQFSTPNPEFVTENLEAPGEPRTRKSLPSLSTMVGVIAESGRLPGPMALAGPWMSP